MCSFHCFDVFKNRLVQLLWEELSKQNTELNIANNNLSEKNAELSDRINKLEEQLQRLKAKRFGTSSEKLEHLLEEEETLLGFQSKVSFTVEDNIKEKGQAKRKKLPSHLLREAVILKPEARCDFLWR